MCAGFFCTYGDYKWYVDAYNSGEYSIVKGHVEDFREEGVGDQRVKYAAVDGQEFVIRGAAYVMSGYNEGLNEDEPVKSGRYVKIWHIDGAIIRLEVCV